MSKSRILRASIDHSGPLSEKLASEARSWLKERRAPALTRRIRDGRTTSVIRLHRFDLPDFIEFFTSFLEKEYQAANTEAQPVV